MSSTSTILDFSSELNRAADSVALDRTCCESIARAFDAELASVLDIDAEAGVFRFRHSMDLSEEQAEQLTLRLDEGICGAAAASGNVIAVFDATKTPQHSSKVKESSNKTVGSLLAVPVFAEGRCACVVEVMNRRSGPFTAEDKQVAAVMGALYMQRRLNMAAGSKGPARKKSPKAATGEQARIVGSSLAMERVLRLISKAAPTDLPVLILGETGAGKELVAQRVHAGSKRSGKPLVAINCAALSETLLESELFGHAKGAFTGATRDRRGRLEEANGGTVFLDEVGDMTPACQAKLLRALDYGEITPVGSNEVRKIDIRIIAATNQPLSKMVAAGKFRGDLFFRLRGFQLDLPPLRDRADDIPRIADHFLAQINLAEGSEIRGFSPEATEIMRKYRWPGNVRELFHAVKMAAAVAEGQFIEAEDLPSEVMHAQSDRASVESNLDASAAESGSSGERARIVKALQETAYPGTGRWNMARAARELGFNRKSLEYKVRKVYRLTES